MTWNSLTKFIKVACAGMGFVFVGVFPKKSQNPKLKQEIQGISWLRADWNSLYHTDCETA